MEKALTVIIPAYKAETYLPDTLGSVLGQTFGDFEVIVVDDCSPDDGKTLAVARRYAGQDPRVRVLSTPENAGPGAARNVGIAEAKGEYLAFVDADDILAPDAFASMMTLARDNDADVVRCRYCLLLPDGSVQGEKLSGEPKVYDEPATLRRIALNVLSPSTDPALPPLDLGGSAWGVLYRRSLLLSRGIRFPEIRRFMSEEYPVAFRMACAARRYVFTPRTYYRYRMVDSSITHSVQPDIVERIVASARYFIDMLRSDPDFREEEIDYARGYVVHYLRAFVKQMLLSDALTAGEKRRWMEQQRMNPFVRECYDKYPWRRLPLRHRLHFKAFAEGRFILLTGLLKAQNAVRKFRLG